MGECDYRCSTLLFPHRTQRAFSRPTRSSGRLGPLFSHKTAPRITEGCSFSLFLCLPRGDTRATSCPANFLLLRDILCGIIAAFPGGGPGFPGRFAQLVGFSRTCRLSLWFTPLAWLGLSLALSFLFVAILFRGQRFLFCVFLIDPSSRDTCP